MMRAMKPAARMDSIGTETAFEVSARARALEATGRSIVYLQTAEPSNVFVTVGGKGVMVYAIMALIDPGDEAIVPDPGYPIYESITRFVGGTPVPIPIRMER